MSKSIEERYRKLTEVEHVLTRPGRYIGSITNNTELYHVLDGEKFVEREVTWSPALLKLFDEIVSNCADFSKTKNGSHLTEVNVDIIRFTGEICVKDNGGIPVVKHSEYNQYVPEFIFGELRAGENFDDDEDSTSTGQNGEGAALVNIFSKEFVVHTCDGKKVFNQKYTNNSQTKTKPVIANGTHNNTMITFLPDYEKLGTELTDDNYSVLERRVYELAATNPHLKIFLNGVYLAGKGFETFVKRFTDDYVYDNGEDFRVAVSTSDNGFTHTSYVNSTHTKLGGNHVTYVMDQIISDIRSHIKKKHKVDVKPSDIKHQINLFIDCTIINPRYSSQTKDELITDAKNFKTTYTPSPKFIAKLLKSSVIEKIMEWVYAKQKAQEMLELRKLNKDNNKANLKKIVKFEDATERNERDKCVLLLAEGDSAANPLINARDPKTTGVMPLKGKPVNVHDVDVKKLLNNEEFKNILAITGLEIGKKATIDNLRFGKIVVASDADLDGLHIRGLVYNMLYKFWPELYDIGVVGYLKTPIIRVTQNKKVIEFFTLTDYNAWEQTNTKPFKSVYIKGLGSNETKDIKRYLSDSSFIETAVVETDKDRDALDLVFNSKRADDRKEWLLQ